MACECAAAGLGCSRDLARKQQSAQTISKPITPAEIAGAKRNYIPAVVFDAFNAEIALRFSIGRAIVPQKAVLTRLQAAGINTTEAFDAGWMNVEESYQAAGWKVSYSKPGYNESGDAYFEFVAGTR
jgi:hypothetical protein